MSASEEYQNEQLEELAQTIKVAKPKSKKGKKFADASFMLSLVDPINRREEEKIQSFLEDEARLLKLMAGRKMAKIKKTRQDKKGKLEEMKQRLRSAKESAGSGKNSHRKAVEHSKKPKGVGKAVRFG